MPHAVADERLVTIVLCGDDGSVLGQIPTPVVVAPRWWPEVDSVVTAVRERFGLVVTVLRLLTTDSRRCWRRGRLPRADPIRAAEDADRAATRLGGCCARQRRHAPVVVGRTRGPGPPARLGRRGAAGARTDVGPARCGQRKTWNLSVVVTAPTDGGDVWFKATPPFLADEGGVIRRVASADPDLVPVLLAHDPGRRAILMDHVAGQDQFGLTDEAVAEAMVRRWVAVQAALVDDVEHALSLGGRDLRAVSSAGRGGGPRGSSPRSAQALTAAELRALERSPGRGPAPPPRRHRGLRAARHRAARRHAPRQLAPRR